MTYEGRFSKLIPALIPDLLSTDRTPGASVPQELELLGALKLIHSGVVGFSVARILIVEDEEQVRVLAESILQEDRHETLSASTTEQALALLDTEPNIDLLFTDLGLHTDLQAGLNLGQEAKQRVPNLPVLYTTGQGITDGMQAMFVEPFGFLSKPYTAVQLTNAVANLVSRKK